MTESEAIKRCRLRMRPLERQNQRLERMVNVLAQKLENAERELLEAKRELCANHQN